MKTETANFIPPLNRSFVLELHKEQFEALFHLKDQKDINNQSRCKQKQVEIKLCYVVCWLTLLYQDY